MPSGSAQRPDEQLEAHAQALRERGFSVVERSHTPETVAKFRAALEALHRSHGAPVPYSAKGEQLADDLQLAPTGFVVTKLLARFPELAHELLCPDVVEIVRRVLGRDMHLELTGAVLCDANRPFFSWHNHIGGIDVEDYRARTSWPRFDEPQRVIAVLYLDDIDDRGGELRAYPRAIQDPTDAPFDEMTPDWPGHVALHFPAGSTVIFEQCTWHAAMPRSTPGLRMFVGAYLTSARAPETDAVDDSLASFTGGGELLQSLLRRA
jgi:ectoine hydroxylase-related dioxygenase (phytanoyl-CoA dioxygenase family)